MDITEIPRLPMIIAIVAIIAAGGGIYALTTSHQIPIGNMATNQEQTLTDEQMMNNMGENATDNQENINYEDSEPSESTDYFNSGSYDSGYYQSNDEFYEPIDEQPSDPDEFNDDNQYEEPADDQDILIDDDNQDNGQSDDDNQDEEPSDNDDQIDDGSTSDQIEEPFDPLDDPGTNPDNYDDLEDDNGEDGGSMEL